ncbi:oligosaccharide flippase family protein [Methanosarcina sp. Mfa9]|uniref:oligosaccharide flippase family protein n=1 Tax=Methanosarcina sp. Mfa9 TaxID=3439063 RepID=UPI003F87B5F9
MLNLFLSTYFSHKETIHNFTWRFLQILGKQGITFFIFILCAKLLTPYDFGIYNYTLAIIYFLIIFGDFGISTATSKYVAEYNATDKNKLKLVLFNSLILTISLGAVVTLLTLLFGSYILDDKYIYIIYVLPMLFLAPISSLYDGIFRGLKRFKELAIISLSIGLLSIIFVYLLVENYGLIGALISQSLFYLFLVLSLFFVYGNLCFQIDRQLMRTVFNYSLIIGISSIAYYLYSRVDIIVLGHYGYVKEIGYYELINKGFELMFLPFALLAQVLAPNITTYFSKKEYSKVRTKFNFFTKLIIPLAILMAILFYFTFPQIIKLFFAEYYVEEMLIAIFILSFLIPTKIWGVFQTQSFIVATGFAKIITVTTLLGGILNVILDVTSIHLIGFTGVFWVTLMIHSFNIIFQTIYYKHKIGQI